MQQCKNTKKKNNQTGRWTQEEHSRFILGVVNYGKNWKKVQQLVGTRTGSQIRSHAQKFFNRLGKVKKNFKDHPQISQQSLLKAYAENVSEKINDLQTKLPLPHKQDQHSVFSDSQSESEGIDKKQTSQSPSQISPRLAQMIKKQSDDGKKPIQYKKFIDLLEEQKSKVETNIHKRKQSIETNQEIKTYVQNAILEMEHQRIQLQNFTHLLIAYITLHGDSIVQEDESFFYKMIKSQSQYILTNKFFDLVDLPIVDSVKPKISQNKCRKKSFSLMDQSEQFKKQLGNLRKIVKITSTEQDCILTKNHIDEKQTKKQSQQKHIIQQSGKIPTI